MAEPGLEPRPHALDRRLPGSSETELLSMGKLLASHPVASSQKAKPLGKKRTGTRLDVLAGSARAQSSVCCLQLKIMAGPEEGKRSQTPSACLCSWYLVLRQYHVSFTGSPGDVIDLSKVPPSSLSPSSSPLFLRGCLSTLPTIFHITSLASSFPVTSSFYRIKFISRTEARQGSPLLHM